MEKEATRDNSIDIARGLAIVAIVIGHVNRGLIASGLGATWSLDLDRGLYLFHLSVFAWLAGLYLRPGVERRGPRSMLVDRTAMFLWLYVLWHVLQVSVKLATASLVNTPGSPADLLRLWVPEGQLWFLPWLASVTVLVVLWRPWLSRPRALTLLGLALVLAIATWGLDPVPVFTRGGALLFPFALGVVAGADGHRRLFAGPSSPLVAIVGLGGLLAITLLTEATPPTVDTPGRTVASIALGIAGCLLGTAGLLALAGWWSRLGGHAAVAFVGRRSLEIFLAHIVPASGTRIVLSRLGVDGVWPQLLLGTAAGVAAALLLWWICQRLRIAWLFGLPKAVASRLG